MFVYIIAILFIGCEKNIPASQIAGKSISSDTQSEETRIFDGERILVILGKEYDNPDFYLASLKKVLPVEISPQSFEVLRYTDLTKNISGIRTKIILEKIEEQRSTLVIAIGAPQKTGHYFIQVRKAFPDIRIAALLPMDEILSLEASCTVIADFAPNSAALADAHDFTVSPEESETLFAAAFLMFSKQPPNFSEFFSEPLTTAFKQAAEILGYADIASAYTIEAYIDPQTNIPSHRYVLLTKRTTQNVHQGVNNE